jgi:hypothetical protein
VEFAITIFYINDGGPFTFYFDKTHYNKALENLKIKFEKIKNCKEPKLIWNNPAMKWKCTSFCSFGKRNINGELVQNYNDSACKHVQNDLINLGLDRVTDKYYQDKAYEGGGRYT